MFDNDSKEIFLFYGWWQFGGCLFAFLALLTIWWHIGRNRKDHGQAWLAISVLCWTMSGLVEVLFVSQTFINEQYIEVA
jgi:predicted Co/Zn/Cd cation transporter (cation efflux family)